jgi:outer membrane protein
MKIKTIAAVLLAAGVAASASVESSAAQTAASPPPIGPAIPGVCVLSQEALVHNSAVGKFVITRMGQLKAQVEAELNSQGSALQTDIKTFQGQAASLTPDQQQKQGSALEARQRAFQQLAQLREKELEATSDKALGVVVQNANPIISTVIGQRSCSILLNGSAVLAAAPAMDISPQVIQQLDAKIQQFAFDREHLDTQAAAPAQ